MIIREAAMKKILTSVIACFVCFGAYAMNPGAVLSESKSYDWCKIASFSPLRSDLENEDSSTYAFGDKSKANFSFVESSALSGGAISQYCMYDALTDLARKNTNGIRRAYYTQAIYFLIISACKGEYWKSVEDLDFYLCAAKSTLTRDTINVEDCGTLVDQLVSYLAGA